jgi:hypothetical protein
MIQAVITADSELVKKMRQGDKDLFLLLSLQSGNSYERKDD